MSLDEDALGPMQRDMLGELRRHYDADTAEAGLLALREEIAHELAEKIRNSDKLRNWTDDHMADCNLAADLIDPEVE